MVQLLAVTEVMALITNLYSTQTVELREVDELATLCHMSPSTFKREFKKEFASSPAKYINDPLYLTRLFTRKGGVPPSTYRSKLVG